MGLTSHEAWQRLKAIIKWVSNVTQFCGPRLQRSIHVGQMSVSVPVYFSCLNSFIHVYGAPTLYEAPTVLGTKYKRLKKKERQI